MEISRIMRKNAAAKGIAPTYDKYHHHQADEEELDKVVKAEEEFLEFRILALEEAECHNQRTDLQWHVDGKIDQGAEVTNLIQGDAKDYGQEGKTDEPPGIFLEQRPPCFHILPHFHPVGFRGLGRRKPARRRRTGGDFLSAPGAKPRPFVHRLAAMWTCRHPRPPWVPY